MASPKSKTSCESLLAAISAYFLYTLDMRNYNIKMTCLKCQKKFNPLYGSSPKKFCSNFCYLENRWGKFKKPSKCLTCENLCKSTGKRTQKFCSSPCKWKWQSINIRGINHPRFKYRIPYGSKSRYWAILSPHHPFNDSKGYVMEHRLVMEKKIGRFLKRNEVVHHIDENPQNNAIENLILMAKKDHDRHHSIARWAQKKGAKPAEKVF